MTEHSRASDVVRWATRMLAARAKQLRANGDEESARQVGAMAQELSRRRGEVVPSAAACWWLRVKDGADGHGRAAGPFTDGERAALEDLVAWLKARRGDFEFTWTRPPTGRKYLEPGGQPTPYGY